jgi:hypothetical protein
MSQTPKPAQAGSPAAGDDFFLPDFCNMAAVFKLLVVSQLLALFLLMTEISQPVALSLGGAGPEVAAAVLGGDQFGRHVLRLASVPEEDAAPTPPLSFFPVSGAGGVFYLSGGGRACCSWASASRGKSSWAWRWCAT